MNNNVSIALRAIAVILSAGAVSLFFLVRGEIENANKKAQPLVTAAATSAEPYDYVSLSKPKDPAQKTMQLRDKMEIVAEAYKEISGRRKQKEADDREIANQKATIAERDITIEGLQNDLDAKNKECAALAQELDSTSAKLNSQNAKVAALESELANEKNNTANLQERIANMKTMEEYQAKLDEIVELEKKAERSQFRYGRLRNYIRSKGEVVPAEFPILVDGEVKNDGPVVNFVEPYVLTTISTIDRNRGLVVFSAGASERNLVAGNSYEVEINGVRVGKVHIVDAGAAYSTGEILPGSDLTAFQRGSSVKLIPFVVKKK